MTNAPSQLVEMIMTCRVATVATRASACLIGSSEAAGGQLHITSDGDGALFNEHDIARMDEGGPVIAKRLRPPFAIFLQANGRRNFTLSLTLKADGQVIFDREASQLETIAVDADQLGLGGRVDR